MNEKTKYPKIEAWAKFVAPASQKAKAHESAYLR